MAIIDVESHIGNDMSNFNGWWDFNGNVNDSHQFEIDFTEVNSPTHLTDDGPTGLNPNASGAISFSGAQYLSFDGQDGVLSPTGFPFGISTWYRMKDQSSDQGFHQKIAGTDGFALHYESAAGGYWRFNLGGSLDGNVGDSTNDATTNTWEHMVAWYDPSNTSVNVTKNANSTITTATTATDPPTFTTADYEIGRIFTNGSRMDLAQFVYFAGIPSTEFINKLYNAGARQTYYDYKTSDSRTTISATLENPPEGGVTQEIGSDVGLLTTIFNSLILVKHLQLEAILATNPSFDILVKRHLNSDIDTDTTIFSSSLLKKYIDSSTQTDTSINALATLLKYLESNTDTDTTVSGNLLKSLFINAGIASQTNVSSRAQLKNILEGLGDSGTTLEANLLRGAFLSSDVDTLTTISAILTVIGGSVVNEIISNLNTNTTISADVLRKAILGSGISLSTNVSSNILLTKLFGASNSTNTSINAGLLKNLHAQSGIASQTSASSTAQLIKILEGLGDSGTQVSSNLRGQFNLNSFVDTNTTISALLDLITGSAIVEIISNTLTSTSLTSQALLKYHIGSGSTSISVTTPNALVLKYLASEIGTDTTVSLPNLLASKVLNGTASGSTEISAILNKITQIMSDLDTDTTITASVSIPSGYEPVITITITYGNDPVSNNLVGIATETSTKRISNKPNLTVTSSKPQYVR